MGGKHVKTMQQVKYLLSDGSPLSAAQKKKLQRELHEGKLKVAKGKKS